MFRALPVRFLATALAILLCGTGSLPARGVTREAPSLTDEQMALIDFASHRFETQRLALPHLDFVFHDSLSPCDGHKGRYWGERDLIEMCSLDKTTLVHEMAHAWVRANLTLADQERFMETRGLETWNDHEVAWQRRGTEHAAETIAWALMDNPHHVEWIEILPDGTKQVGHRILTIDVEVEVLIENFHFFTGMSPVFRDASEWSVDHETPLTSIEVRR